MIPEEAETFEVTPEASLESPPRGRISAALSWFIRAGVWLYRMTLGPFMGGHCRFQPSCSQYMLDAVERYGPIRGGWRGLKRICRCQPWGGSGHDPA